MCSWISGDVYRNWFLHVLEGLFAQNLLILAVLLPTMSNTQEEINSQLDMLVYIAFAIFSGILVFQLSSVTSLLTI